MIWELREKGKNLILMYNRLNNFWKLQGQRTNQTGYVYEMFFMLIMLKKENQEQHEGE